MGTDYKSHYFYGICLPTKAIRGEDEEENPFYHVRKDCVNWLEKLVKNENLQNILFPIQELTGGTSEDNPIWICAKKCYTELNGDRQSRKLVIQPILSFSDMTEFQIAIQKIASKYNIGLADQEVGYFLTNERC